MGEPLPADVAAAIGVADAATVDRGALRWPGQGTPPTDTAPLGEIVSPTSGTTVSGTTSVEVGAQDAGKVGTSTDVLVTVKNQVADTTAPSVPTG